MIKAVIFDIDGVLIESFEANFKFYQNLISKAGYEPPTRKKFTLFHHFSMMDSIKTYTKILHLPRLHPRGVLRLHLGITLLNLKIHFEQERYS